LEPTKSSALSSLKTGRLSRFLPWTSTAATASEGARRTPSALGHRPSSLFPFRPSPASGSLHDGLQQLVQWPPPDEPVTAPMLIAKATAGQLDVVLGLVSEASEWLRTKKTDQWARPWPTEEARDQRVLTGLQNEKTWIVWDGDTAAATVTIATKANINVWQDPARTCDLSEKAVYVHRLITARKYAGTGLGEELINWAGLRGKRRNRAKWIRIDVWTSNEALHAYYENLGFVRCGECPDPLYPSGALFQKPTSALSVPVRPHFTEYPDRVVRTSTRELVDALPSAM
jgi:GNAT superfamily N-acetyltransferase